MRQELFLEFGGMTVAPIIVVGASIVTAPGVGRTGVVVAAGIVWIGTTVVPAGGGTYSIAAPSSHFAESYILLYKLQC